MRMMNTFVCQTAEWQSNNDVRVTERKRVMTTAPEGTTRGFYQTHAIRNPRLDDVDYTDLAPIQAAKVRLRRAYVVAGVLLGVSLLTAVVPAVYVLSTSVSSSSESSGNWTICWPCRGSSGDLKCSTITAVLLHCCCPLMPMTYVGLPETRHQKPVLEDWYQKNSVPNCIYRFSATGVWDRFLVALSVSWVKAWYRKGRFCGGAEEGHMPSTYWPRSLPNVGHASQILIPWYLICWRRNSDVYTAFVYWYW